MREAFGRRKILYGISLAAGVVAFILSIFTLSIHHLYPGLSLSETNLRNGIILFLCGCVVIYTVVYDLVMDAEAAKPAGARYAVLLKRWFYLTLWFVFLGLVFTSFSEDPFQLWYDLNNLFG